MTLRRRLAVFVFAAGSSVGVFGQPAPDGNTPSNAAVAENMNLRFANGIVAVAEEKIITVADVMQEIGPLLANVRASSRNEKEFQQQLEQLQDDTIQNLIDRVLIVKE